MECQWDADFRDENQCYAYNQLAGCTSQPYQRCNGNEDQVGVPDLAELTDEEFLQRISDMRREHQLALELCDKLGLHPRSDDSRQHCSPFSPGLPTASVDDEYTVSTQKFRSLAGDLIMTGDDIRKPFKARKAPPRTDVPIDGRQKCSKNSRKEKERLAQIQDEQEQQEMREYMMEKYLSSCFNDDCDLDSFMDGGTCNARRPHLARSRSLSKLPSADSEWQYRITVPKPFQMTLRESCRPAAKSRTAAEYEQMKADLHRQQENMRNKKFRANPAPATIYVPLYDELTRKMARQRQVNVARRQKELQDLQRPFAFLRREEERRLERNHRQAAFATSDAIVPDANFKAKPFPEHLFNNEAYEKLSLQEDIRQEERQARAEELLRSASLPKNMLKKRPSHTCDMSGDENCKKCDSTSDVRRSDYAARTVRDSQQHQQHRLSQAAANVNRSVDGMRWPLTNVNACQMSRSLSDMLSASGAVQSKALRRSESSHNSRPHSAVKSAVTPTGGSSKQNPAQRTRAPHAAGTLTQRWPYYSVNDVQLRREIEADLNTIVL